MFILSAGDRVVFAENTANPGVPIVYRTPDEKSANPDRLNLDRYRQTQFLQRIRSCIDF